VATSTKLKRVAPLKTVQVPEQFREIFAKAEDFVRRYFNERIENPEESTIAISGERYVLVRAASMSVEFFDLVVSLYKDKGEPEARLVANNLLFDLAHAIGKADAKSFNARMGVVDPVERLSAGPVHFAFSGWASVDILPTSKPTPDEHYYLIYNHPFSFESDAWIKRGRRAEYPVCIMNAGYSSGWCEESFGIPLVAAEVECLAAGGRNCRFIMAPPSRIEGHLERYFEASPSAHRRTHQAQRTVAVPEFFQRKRMEDALQSSYRELEERVRERTLEVTHAYERLQAETAERERSQKLESALFRIASTTTSAANLNQLYGEIHAIIAELMYAKNCYIALYDPETEYVSFPYWVDEEDPPLPPRKGKRGLTEYVLRTGKPLLATPEMLEDLVAQGEVDRVGAPSLDWMGIPLKRGDQTYGALVLQTYEPNIRYGEKEKEILIFVSQQIAAAIENKRTQEALQNSEAQYRSLFETAVHGIYRSTLAGRFQQVNPALIAMLGYDNEDEVLKLDIANDVYADPGRREHFIAEYKYASRINGIEAQWKRRNGNIFTVRLSGRALLSGAGEPLGFQMIAEDTTERRSLEDQLRQSQKMEAIGRLAGGIAHDFNNLLTVIQGYSDLLLEKMNEKDPKRIEASEIKKAAERASSLTQQLLSFSRQQVIAPRIFDLNNSLRQMDGLLRRILGEDVQLETRLDAGLGGIKADPGQIEQVVMNLAVNARDAMPRGGRLIIETSNYKTMPVSSSEERPGGLVPGDYVMLAVTDTGTGMDEQTKARIFEPFFTTKPQGKGTGLGLSTVYGIVKQSEGHISVQTQVGAGTAFRIFFPRVGVQSDTPILAPLLQGIGGDETVLVVEDEAGVRSLVRQVLQTQGYRVLEAKTGAEALTLCGRPGDIHLLLTDVVLESMNGRELSEQVCEMRPKTKTIFMSGYTDDAVLRHGVLSQNTPFLQKPFSPSALLKLVRRVLDN
jgi:PAS domain S-box-containing protein